MNEHQHWHQGQPVKPLHAWLNGLQLAMKYSAREAVEAMKEALQTLAAEGRLLLMHPTDGCKPVGQGFGPPAPKRRPTGPSVQRASGRVYLPGYGTPSDDSSGAVQPRGAAYVVPQLLAAWAQQLGRGKLPDSSLVRGWGVGMTEADAWATWPELAPAKPVHLHPVEQAASGAVDWHSRKGPWTDDQRNALVRMRWQEKLSETVIAKRVGVSRQRIAELIGKRSDKGSAKGIDGWKPSAELLKACGLQLAPLQALAAVVSSSRDT